MPPYPIARIPKIVPPEKQGLCVPEGHKLQTVNESPWLMFCPECECECGYRKEDVYMGRDGLVVPCEEHWTDDCYWREG
jgi:hypothetical protein